MGWNSVDTFTGVDGIAVPLSVYVEQVEKGNNKRKLEEESEEYNKDSGKFLGAVRKNIINGTKRADRRGVYHTKIFSFQEIKKEEEKMASEMRRRILEVLMKNEGQWISGANMAKMVEGPRSSVSAVLTGLSRFLIEEGLGDKQKDGVSKGFVHRFKAHVAGDLKKETGLLYEKFLVWEKGQRKPKDKGGDLSAPVAEDRGVEEPNLSFKDIEPGGGIFNAIVGTVLSNLPKSPEGSTLNVNVQVKVLFGLVRSQI